MSVLDVSDQPADSTANIGHVLTGEAPGWKTDVYRGSPDFAGLKSGLGLVFRLKEPGEVHSVSIETPTPGFNVELRTSDQAQPSSLDATTEVGSGSVDEKTSTLTVDSPKKAPHFIVWLTSLPEGSGGFQAIVNRVTLR